MARPFEDLEGSILGQRFQWQMTEYLMVLRNLAPGRDLRLAYLAGIREQRAARTTCVEWAPARGV